MTHYKMVLLVTTVIVLVLFTQEVMQDPPTKSEYVIYWKSPTIPTESLYSARNTKNRYGIHFRDLSFRFEVGDTINIFSFKNLNIKTKK